MPDQTIEKQVAKRRLVVNEEHLREVVKNRRLFLPPSIELPHAGAWKHFEKIYGESVQAELTLTSE